MERKNVESVRRIMHSEFTPEKGLREGIPFLVAETVYGFLFNFIARQDWKSDIPLEEFEKALQKLSDEAIKMKYLILR